MVLRPNIFSWDEKTVEYTNLRFAIFNEYRGMKFTIDNLSLTVYNSTEINIFRGECE